SLIAAAQAPDYPAEIALVVSNRPGAPGLARAAEAGIRTAVVDHKVYPDRAAFEAELGGVLAGEGVEFVCLAGFMRIFTDRFVESWAGRMLNIHPSLLPSFKGLHPHGQALEAGARIHGCTVHFVVPELDSGPIVAQAAVPVLPGDSEDVLAARVLAQEHRLYPLGLRLVAGGEARLNRSRVDITPGAVTALGLAASQA
ncbi:MAG TPA: phosphoribosylglycinamide formyltransferase, partial [Methylobacterium sp.]|nr:phosphoribosylglycinamide formyltransferase [Methylobacterium sp.]